MAGRESKHDIAAIIEKEVAAIEAGFVRKPASAKRKQA